MIARDLQYYARTIRHNYGHFVLKNKYDWKEAVERYIVKHNLARNPPDLSVGRNRISS